MNLVDDQVSGVNLVDDQVLVLTFENIANINILRDHMGADKC